MRGMISVSPASFIPPYIEKCQISWDTWFSLINNHLCSDYLPPFVANFSITWLLPSPPQSTALRATWDAASWAWSPKNSHWIKQLSTFRLWLVFLVDTWLTDKGTRADSSSSPGCYRDPEPWFLCPSACSASPDESGWVSPGSRISHYWLMILSFYSVGEKVILETWFQGVPGCSV